MVASAATAAARAKMKSQLQMVVGLRDAVLLFDDDAIADLCVFVGVALDNNNNNKKKLKDRQSLTQKPPNRGLVESSK